MIKIEPLLPTDYAQTQALLADESHFLPVNSADSDNFALSHGLTFWQHWLPCTVHVFPSVYVARENGVVIGLIALRSEGKSKSCFRLEHLVVHPDHRGRGIAQELLRYVFAFFGGQGVNHFIVEVSDQNSAALQLLGSCGFKRCAKIIYLSRTPSSLPTLGYEQRLHKAVSSDSHGLFQLYQDALPPDIRVIFSYTPADFAISDSKELKKLKQKATHQQVWYWLWENPERHVITSAVRVSLNNHGNIRLNFAIHPGWSEQAAEFIECCLGKLATDYPESVVTTKVFDFEAVTIEALQKCGMQSTGQFCLLAREHWIRARQPKVRQRNITSISGIANPAVNFPLATD